MLTQTIGRYTSRIFTGNELPMRGADLEVQITPAPDALVVALIGEAHVDFDQAESHIQKILSYHPRHVIVDASQLSFLSSVGMCFLINLRRGLTKAGSTLTIAALQPLVHNALTKARILSLFQTATDVQAAKLPS